MNSGVIIVFSNNEKEIINFNAEYLASINANKICFVNNASTDNTLNLLNEIQFKSEKNIYILDIKIDKGLKAAIKSGARFLTSESDFDFIVYLKPNMLDSLSSLQTFLANFQENKQDYNALPTRSRRNVLFDVFSIHEILKKKHVA
jgi:dTDP-glucose pyrophosphorylase